MTTTSFSTSVISLHQDTQHTTTDGCFQTAQPVFAMPKHGNKVDHLITGKALFAEIAKAILGAKRFILFTDWQMDYDVELHERGNEQYVGRFSELLAKKVAEGVEVKVLLYDSFEAAVYTHENEVRSNLARLNPKSNELGKKGAPARNPAGNLPVEVAIQRPTTGRTVENMLFSHHQKSIVIDGTVAFIGGMDVTYGRWCDSNFDVVADPVKHRINDMYNPGVGQGRRLTEDEVALTQDWAGRKAPADYKYGPPRPGFAPPYYIIGVMRRRVLELVNRGYSVEQLEAMVELMQIDDQIRDYLAQKARELRAVVQAISRTLNHYAQAKKRAGQQLLKGNFLEAVSLSIDADIQLAKVALRKIDQGVDAVSEAFNDSVDSQLKDYQRWFDDSMDDLKADLARFNEYRDNPKLLLIDSKRLKQDILATQSEMFDDFCLEEGCQPRMPWQDIQCRIEGPAVHDVFANFVRRWNVAVHDDSGNNAYYADPKTKVEMSAKPLGQEWLARWGNVQTVFGDMSKHGTKGQVTVQIVRSMSHLLLVREARYAPALPLPHLLGATSSKAAQAALNTKPQAGHTVHAAKQMDGVLEAMIHAIQKAQAYIYIETQFFISDCDKSDNFEDAIANNSLIATLAERIGAAVQTGKAFHVYVVLPVHPEGNLQDGGVAKQHYWALQTLKRGKKSLVRRVCESMVRKQKNLKLADKPDKKDVQAMVDGGTWHRYLTFLNLRNWGATALFPRDPKTRERLDTQKPLGQFIITEQIYVHSKLMIVDDAIAIIGSANCNDRSLNGDGDTELAAVIVDNEVSQLDLGNGTKVNTRKFARELRVALWQKHLGLKIEGKDYTLGDQVLSGIDRGKVKHAGQKLLHPPRQSGDSAKGASKVDVHKPAAMATWQAIQAIASANAKVYEEVFQHTPRNSMGRFSDTQTGWPKRVSRVSAGARVANRIMPKAAPNMLKTKVEAMAKEDWLVTDFSTLPPQLQSGFMEASTAGSGTPYKDAHVQWPERVHGMEQVITKVLKPRLIGFWVEMPLEFGIKEKDSWLSGHFGNTAVAQNDGPKDADAPQVAAVPQAHDQDKEGVA